MSILMTALLALSTPQPMAFAAMQQDSKSCSIDYTSDSMVADALSDGFDFAEYGPLCEWLTRNGLGVSIDGDSGILAERAYGFAVVRIYRRTNGVRSTQTGISSTIERRADTPTARQALRGSIMSAMSIVAQNRDAHLRSLVAVEQNGGRQPS